MGPGDLQNILNRTGSARTPEASRLLVGTETGDDAGVLALKDDTALVVTTDFVTPVCDDPYVFGQVAAANALSDVYAMGGRPLVALAICAFPEALDVEQAAAICAGGAAKVAEAGAVVAGGHTVRNAELFYGLAVTGQVHPQQVVRNVGARPGDLLVLTKPLGTGVVINGYRQGKVAEDALMAACRIMAELNAESARLMVAHGAHAATDVTGFGLAGHALKMARGSGVRFRLWTDRLPVLPGVLELIDQGVTSKGARLNREAAQDQLVRRTGAAAAGRHDDPAWTARDLLVFDPQTAGGLLVALPPERAATYSQALVDAGVAGAAIIGEVTVGAAADAPLEIGPA